MNAMNKDEMKSRYISDLRSLLSEIYELLKAKGEMPFQQKSGTEGFMLAGSRLGLVDKRGLEILMEQAHQSVFGMSIQERRLMELKGEQFEVDWSYYDKPISQRLNGSYGDCK